MLLVFYQYQLFVLFVRIVLFQAWYVLTNILSVCFFLFLSVCCFVFLFFLLYFIFLFFFFYIFFFFRLSSFCLPLFLISSLSFVLQVHVVGNASIAMISIVLNVFHTYMPEATELLINIQCCHIILLKWNEHV